MRRRGDQRDSLSAGQAGTPGERGMKLRQRLRERGFWLALLRWLIPVALVAVLAGLLADTIWLLVYGPSDPVPTDSSLPDAEATADQGSSAVIEYEQVRQWALFGQWEDRAEKASNKQEPIDVPETRLQLELLGVFQTGDEGQAGAIIAEQGQNGELYRVGDRLPGNALLEEVYADRVILRRQGKLETLKFKEPGLKGGGVQPVQRSSGSAPERDENQQARGSSGDSVFSGDVARQRQRIIRGLGLEKNSQGYVIGKSAPAQLLDRVGLKPGDVIVSVNGHEVGRKEADLAALREYHEKGSAKVVVKRGAQRFTVSVPP